MQKVIPPSISYSVSDLVTWEVWLDGWVKEADLSKTNTPTNTGELIQTGIIKQLDSKEQLTIEPIIGIQVQLGSMYKVFARDLDVALKVNKSLLVMQSHVTNHGVSMPLISGYFRVIQKPKRLDTENWIYLYKLE